MVLLDLVSPKGLDELDLWASLNLCSIKSQVFRCPKVCNELGKSISDMVTVYLHHRIGDLEATIVQINL
jgi:hypothetical protein